MLFDSPHVYLCFWLTALSNFIEVITNELYRKPLCILEILCTLKTPRGITARVSVVVVNTCSPPYIAVSASKSRLIMNVQLVKQESLANAVRQVSARQPCVYEDLFLPSHRCLTPPSWKRLAISTQSIHRWHVHLVGYSSIATRRQYGSVFIRLAVIASETRDMSRNSKRIWPYSSSRSSKGHRSWCQWKLINCNFSRIYYRFRDIHA